jgi:predicted signal transduction protein with EAL and GGDEF domain
VRDSDTVARLGGDEFTIILRTISDPDDAGRIAQKIRQSLAQPFLLDAHELFVTASIGISLYPEDGNDAETLIKNADTAMYRAKDTGRNNYQFYAKEMSTRFTERIVLENDLRKALDREEMSIEYQPQVDIATGTVVGVEALARWRHKDRGVIPPEVFIPIAEETGLIFTIGEWVLRAATKQAKAWIEAGNPHLRLAVNVSAGQLHHEELVDVIADILQSTGLPHTHLELELTESVLMENAKSTIQVLSSLNRMGIRIAVDDFGTGYSSLSYLKRFAIDKLKIDKSFVGDITTDENDAEISATIIAMGHKLNLKVIAEGVETQDQLDALRRQGCDEMQGYLFSRPLSAGEISRLLATGMPVAIAG